MENYVSEQLATLLSALLLGGLAAWLYDLLRLLRLRRQSKLLLHLTDALYVGLVLLVLLRFALYRGGGELRLYMMIGAALGCIGYFLLLSRRLRPLWSFWVETGTAFGGLLLYPVRRVLVTIKKVADFSKKHFQFIRKWVTIKKYTQELQQMHHFTARQGGQKHLAQQKKKTKKT